MAGKPTISLMLTPASTERLPSQQIMQLRTRKSARRDQMKCDSSGRSPVRSAPIHNQIP